MVFFNCNSCGESLKKNQVEKHYQTKCRKCEVLSCVDCGKDFWGDDYQKHVKCISEEEKYSGKNYKPKANANKGEKKQELWIEQVHSAVSKASGNAQLRGVLEKLVDYPNIPRKQAKFENFLKNSLRVNNTALIRKVWDTMSSCMTKEPQENGEKSTAESETLVESEVQTVEENGAENGTDETTKKKSKREKKEERREKTMKKQKKDKRKAEVNGNESNEKKCKKRKRDRETEEVEEREVKKSKQSNKGKISEKTVEEENLSEEEPEPVALTPSKFRWETVIIEVLESADDKEMAVKKLRKKVLNEYFSLVAGKNRLTEERLWSKFEKKITKNPNFKVLKERVKLVSR